MHACPIVAPWWAFWGCSLHHTRRATHATLLLTHDSMLLQREAPRQPVGAPREVEHLESGAVGGG